MNRESLLIHFRRAGREGVLIRARGAVEPFDPFDTLRPADDTGREVCTRCLGCDLGGGRAAATALRTFARRKAGSRTALAFPKTRFTSRAAVLVRTERVVEFAEDATRFLTNALTTFANCCFVTVLAIFGWLAGDALPPLGLRPLFWLPFPDTFPWATVP